MTEAAYLIDSNIAIYVLADERGPAALRIGECRPGTVVTSSIAYAEVLRGLSDPALAVLEQIDAFYRLVPILPFDADAARAYREVPFKRGTFDRLIAAHALSRQLILVTNNETDFADVPGLAIENWARA